MTPDTPKVCSVFAYHKVFNPGEVEAIERDCRAGALGCVDCKTNLGEKTNQTLDPFRERRAIYEREPERVRDIVDAGTRHAQGVAEETMQRVREVMHLPA